MWYECAFGEVVWEGLRCRFVVGNACLHVFRQALLLPHAGLIGSSLYRLLFGYVDGKEG